MKINCIPVIGGILSTLSLLLLFLSGCTGSVTIENANPAITSVGPLYILQDKVALDFTVCDLESDLIEVSARWCKNNQCKKATPAKSSDNLKAIPSHYGETPINQRFLWDYDCDLDGGSGTGLALELSIVGEEKPIVTQLFSLEELGITDSNWSECGD